MKIVKIISALAAVCALVIGCAKETPNVWNEIQVSSSYVGLPKDGGSKTITVTATDSWSINAIPNWLTISPASGSAGETVVTFTAEKALSNNESTVKIVCAGKEQSIIVRQDAEYIEPKTLTVAEAIEICKTLDNRTASQGEYRVKGVVCSLIDLSVTYGNVTFNISDESGEVFQVYRALWLNNAAFKDGDKLDIGDEVIVEGKLTIWDGTCETAEKQAYVKEINRSLIKCDSLVVDGVKSNLLPIEGGQIDAVLTCKGNGVSVNIPDDAKSWLSVTGIQTAGETATVSFTAAQNAGGDRSTEVTFTTTSEGKDYTAVAAISQTGAIIECSIAEYLAAPEDQTQYRISGIITSVVQDSEQYGANLYIKDATGEVYVYGITDNNGTIQTLAAFGAKDGDIIEFVGTRSSHNGTPQMKKGKFQWYKSVTVKTVAEADALADDPQNYIKITGTVTKPEKSLIDAGTKKWDITNYGNFDLVDETGTIYVYGVTTGWNGTKGNGAFATLGVKEGDKLTIVAYKTSYKGMNQLVGMYVSHESGETPEPVGDDMVIASGDVPTSYPTEATTYTINGYDYSLLNVANYGDGIQMKKNGSYISSLTAAKRAIASVRVDANMAKYDPVANFAWDPSNIKLYVKATADGEEVPVEGVKDDTGITYTVAEGDYKFFTLKNESTFAVYLDKITVSVVAE